MAPIMRWCYRTSPVDGNAVCCRNHRRTEFWRTTAVCDPAMRAVVIRCAIGRAEAIHDR
jgi:hypothetical protein